MLLNSLFTVTGLVCLAQSYVVPSTAGYAAPGFQANPQASNILDSRGGTSIHCAYGIDMDPADTQAAISALKQQVAMTPTLGNQNTTKISGGVIAFICQDDNMPSLFITEGTLAGYLDNIGNECLLNTAGTYTDNFGSSGNIYYGYMRYSPGLDVCHDPGSASASKCSPSKRSEDDQARLAPRIPDNSNALTTRDSPVIHCACGFNTDSGNTQSATADLQTMIGPSPRTITSLTTNAVADSVIAFICQYDKGNLLSIDAGTYGTYAAAIASACGEDVAGTYSLYGTNPVDARHFGYMRYSPGLEVHVCDSPDSAPATTCSPTKRSENRALLAPVAQNTSNVLDTRDGQDYHCQCGAAVEASSHNDAKAAMIADLGYANWTVDSSGNFRHTVVKGDTIAFVCILGYPELAGKPVTYGDNSQVSDFGVDARRIERTCGTYVPGSIARYGGAYTDHYGFMQITPGLDLDPVSICTSPNLLVSAGKC